MKALRAVNNFLASASLALAMLIIFIMVAALFLTIGYGFVGNQPKVETEKNVVAKKASCLESQYEVRLDSGEVTCAENIDLSVSL